MKITNLETNLSDFHAGDEKREGLPYFAVGAEGKKIFEKYRKLSADLGTRLVFRDGMITLEK